MIHSLDGISMIPSWRSSASKKGEQSITLLILKELVIVGATIRKATSVYDYIV
jgi:hypothetical protein